MKIQRIKLTFQKEHLHSVGEKSLVVLSQLAASPGPGVARLIFFGPPTTLFCTDEAPALPYPPPSPLRWLRHPSAARRPSFWHL